MTRLAPKLFDRRYDDLVELGRSQLPRLAPDWTDFNAHDPGITLLELLAWATEAQFYAVGRTSKAERVAYAALFALAPSGTRPARGLIWSSAPDRTSLGAALSGGRVISVDAAVVLDQHDNPRFHPERKVLVSPGRIVSLMSRLADGTQRDFTQINARGAEFLPFGVNPGRRDTLVLEFETATDDGLFPVNRDEAAGAAWVIGVRAADGGAATEVPAESLPSGLSVSLDSGGRVTPLPVLEDTSAGLLRTGVVALDVSRVQGSPRRFRLVIRAPGGFARPPRLSRIAPNVLPITQRSTIDSEPHVATGVPDFECELDASGLCFGSPGDEALRVEVAGDGEYRVCDRLADQGPDDRCFELDADRLRLRFGNGVNGKRLLPQADVFVTYSVSDGIAGNIARNRNWRVAGLPGVFGTNLDPISGGSGRSDLLDLRREARQRLTHDHALVSGDDLVAAALALPLLEVARAWFVPPHGKMPSAGTVTLVVLRARPSGDDSARTLETRAWLEAVRAQLARRVPLGTRLVVRAPAYVDFFVRAELALEIEAKRAPADVELDAKAALRKRLALVEPPLVTEPREPGVPVTRSDVATWLLGVRGVVRVKVELVSGGKPGDVIDVPRIGLPRLDFERSEIRAVRSARGVGA